MTDIEKAVARAEVAVAAYRNAGAWGSNEEVITDLLADLFHYVDSLIEDREIGDFTFDELLNRAEINYTAEVEENKE